MIITHYYYCWGDGDDPKLLTIDSCWDKPVNQ